MQPVEITEEETQSDVEDLPSDVLSEVEAAPGEHARSFGSNMDVLTMPLEPKSWIFIAVSSVSASVSHLFTGFFTVSH